jgi:hypothetical protein
VESARAAGARHRTRRPGRKALVHATRGPGCFLRANPPLKRRSPLFAFSVPFLPFRCLFRYPPPSHSACFFTNVPSSPHTSSRMCICMFGHHPRRLCGWLGASGTQDLRALRLWLAELPAVARTAVELHGCCARVSLAAALLSQHIDGVARAGSAGTKSGSRARSLVLLTMLAPVVENRTVRGPARARRRSELASCPCHLRRRFANFRSVSGQRGPAGPRESDKRLWKACSARTTPFI